MTMLGGVSSMLGIGAITTGALLWRQNNKNILPEYVWTAIISGEVLLFIGATITCIKCIRYPKNARVASRRLERAPNSRSRLLESPPPEPKSVNLPFSPLKIKCLENTSLDHNPIKGFTYLPIGIFLGKLPQTVAKCELFFNQLTPTGYFTLLSIGSQNLQSPRRYYYKPESEDGNFTYTFLANDRTIATNIHLSSFDQLPSLLWALEKVHQCLLKNRKPLIACTDGQSEVSTFTAIFYMHLHFKAGTTLSTDHAIELIKQNYPKATPSKNAIEHFNTFLTQLPPNIQRWYRVGVITPSKTPYLLQRKEQTIHDFQQIVWQAQEIPHYRQHEAEWKKCSYDTRTVPYESNEFKLSGGQLINASKLPFGFIATQTPLSKPDFQEMMTESGACVLIAINISKDEIPPLPPHIKHLYITKSMNFHDIQTIISTAEEHRNKGPIVVMCNDGSIHSCTYIACHLATLILADIAEHDNQWQLSLKNLHALLRLPPLGRPQAIYFRDNYLWIDKFITHFIKEL